MRMGPVSFFTLLTLVPATLGAQRQASLGVGTGIVRYAGGSSFSALTVSPAAQRLSPITYLSVGGAVSLLEAVSGPARAGQTSGPQYPWAQPVSVPRSARRSQAARDLMELPPDREPP